MVSFDTRRHGGGELTLEVSGDVDWDGVLTLEPRWEAEIDAGALTHVTIDLTRVGFVDSTGISLLTSAVERIRGRGAGVRILRPAPHVFRVFEVAGVDDVLPFAEAPQP